MVVLLHDYKIHEKQMNEQSQQKQRQLDVLRAAAAAASIDIPGIEEFIWEQFLWFAHGHVSIIQRAQRAVFIVWPIHVLNIRCVIFCG